VVFRRRDGGTRSNWLERGLEFRQIRYALSVAKQRSFTKAATRLNISQSAVSEQVKLLEDEVGFPLFRRTPRGIEVTERGRTFLYEAERVVGDVLSLSDTARRLKGAPSDTLTIGMGSGMAQIFMPRLFRDPATALPGVRLEILTAPTRSIFNDLHEERIEAGLAIESDPDRMPAGLVFERLTEAEPVLITHAKHALARARPPVDVGRLVAEPIIMSELSVGYGQIVLSLFADLGIRPNILAIADNIETMKVIVQSGRGIAIVPRACVDNEVALGVLKALPIAPARSVALSLFRRRQPLSRRKEGYLAALRDALKGERSNP
jgi:DNA-binding transcriptional LysR family regulator